MNMQEGVLKCHQMSIYSRLVIRKLPLQGKHSYKTYTTFISLLVQHLKDAGFESVQSKGDADTLIAKTALEYAVDDTVTVSAQDTDILIILLHHWSS